RRHSEERRPGPDQGEPCGRGLHARCRGDEGGQRAHPNAERADLSVFLGALGLAQFPAFTARPAVFRSRYSWRRLAPLASNRSASRQPAAVLRRESLTVSFRPELLKVTTTVLVMRSPDFGAANFRPFRSQSCDWVSGS